MKALPLFAMLLTASLSFAQDAEYQFSGKHLLASYLHCDRDALSNPEALIQAMDAAVKASGAAVLDRSFYIFDSNGMTIVYLLSESHASLHSYPECGACFIDLFTCGDHCITEAFDAALQKYLKPQKTDLLYLQRNEQSTPLSYPPISVK